jgi:deazaflavin-dependent oxidoreductase (nitroreductase family)
LKKINPSSSSKDNSFEHEKYLYLTTRGRTRGQPREIEIWFTYFAGRFFVIAEYQASHWLQNLHANPAAKVRVGENNFNARGRVISAEKEAELHRAVADLSRRKYGWGDGVVVELQPEPRDGKPDDST